MRRHYRNHTSPGLSRAQPVEPRRRRRRAQDTDLVFVSADSSSSNAQPLTPATPESSSISDEEDDEDLSPTGGSYRHGSDYHRSAPHHPAAGFEYDTNGNSHIHRRESHLRSSTPMSVSSSPSPPTTPLSEHKYSPSVPYLRSVVTDTTVSTALRPAFTNGRT